MKRFWVNLLLSLTSGILMSLAAPPLNWWWLAWVALVPFWLVISPKSEGSGKQTWLWVLVWGVSYHGITLSWILGLHPLTWMGVPWLASVAIALFCWGFITLWGTLANWVWAWVVGKIAPPGHFTPQAQIRFRLKRVWIGTALWCGLEFGLNLTPLSWTSLSFTQSPGNLVILHLGRLSGPLLVTATIVAFNGLLAEAWLHTQQNRTNSRLTLPLVAIAGLLLVVTHAIGWHFYNQPLNDVPEQALSVGVIQGNIPTREKLSGNGIRRAVQNYVGGYEALVEQGAEAVLTPEGSLPFLWDKVHNPFRAAVLEKKVPAWLGIFVADAGNITQSLLSLDTTGEVVGRYNKIKLVPLGEYIPFQNTLGQLIGRLSPIKSSMVPGTTEQHFDTPFGRAIASICYESVFPELFRQQATTGGQLILTASNLDPYSEMLMVQHQAHDLMRGIETDRWSARATNTGYSGFINPHGKIIWRSQPRTYQLHSETIYRRQTQTMYVRWGDWATPILLGSAAVVWIYHRIRNLHP
ncbi:MAG: apolipoprotein N-acyltransferase [Leptolyngbyaceae cyanobacterium bins.302]|nr:apolipoprotein N-acyltransferase [Leptolyngbyaceae cyanobacterium bins.302]